MNNNIPTTPKEIVIKLLEFCYDTLSYESCNDYLVENNPKNKEFVEKAQKWFDKSCFDEDGITMDDNYIYTLDIIVLSYFIHSLKISNLLDKL